jgi:hypothetical protein
MAVTPTAAAIDIVRVQKVIRDDAQPFSLDEAGRTANSN